VPTPWVLIVPVLVFLSARGVARLAYRVVRAIAEEARQGRPHWWMAGGPEVAARIVLLWTAGAVLVALIVVATAASRRPVARTLGLTRGRVGVAGWLLLAAASFSCWLGAVALVALLARLAHVPEDSAAVGALFDLVRGAPPLLASLLIAGSALGAGVTEELIVRGWLQNQLLERWRPFSAIVASSAVFAVAHGEPSRMLYALVLGLWLGYVAFRCGSVLPGSLCHVVLNGLPLTLYRLGVDPDPARLGARGWTLAGAAALAGLLVTGIAIRMLEKAGRADRAQPVLPPATPSS
jgi:membrane protease YdiL (CAAX protease family)